ncbi:MAG: PAS domain S-box protein [Bacillota bacterium]
MSASLEEQISISTDVIESLKRESAALKRERDYYKEKAKNLERMLSSNNSKIMDAFFSHILSPVAVLDRNFNFIRVNEAYAKADNRDVSDFPGNNHFDFYPSDARDIFEEVVRSKNTYHVHARPFEYKDHPERGITYWDWTLVPVLDKDGEVELLIFFLMDVTHNFRLLENLRHSENHFRSVVQSATDGIITINNWGNIIFWNNAAEKIFGYTPEEAKGKPLTFIMPERFKKTFMEGVKKALSGETYSVTGKITETAGLKKDGTEFPIEVSISKWASNGEIYFTGIIRDLTSRKKAMEEILKLASIVESTDDAIIGITLDDIIETWNSGAERLYGCSAEEVVGRTVQILSEGAPKRIELALDKIRQGIRVESYEAVHKRKDGTDVPVSVTVSPVRDTWGNLSGVSIIARDITEQKKMSEELDKLHHHLVDILESMSDAFIALDQKWRLIYLNKVAENITQRPRETMIGKNIWEVFPDAFGTRQYHMYKRVMEERLAVNFELSGIFSDKIFDVSAYPSPDGISIFYKDVTGRRKMEKEMARLDRLNIVGQMAAGIGHEIRNPMTAIRGFLQILSSKEPCQQYSSYFDIMIGELDRANTIITEFLSMAKNKNEEMRAVNLNIIIEAIFPLIEAQARNSNKDIIIDLGNVPDVLLNEKEIRQLILNLARNGLESMEVGGRLSIKTFLEGDQVVLVVQDQGKGINDQILQKIGTPFFTTKENGTGLGLATCYSIVARHNAEIGFETGPEGTTFLVRFGI